MDRLDILCVLILLSLSVSSADDMMFFADDHYKVIGAPLLLASAANPVLYPESDSTLVILLGNMGKVNELIATQQNGSDEDIRKEMFSEMHSVDAMNITAELHSSGPVVVVSEPYVITSLPAGSVERMMFIISSKDAVGWYELPLTLDYEYQVDATVSDGAVTPLYQPEMNRIIIKVFVQGQDSLSLVGAKSDLHPGGIGTVIAAIKNYGHMTLSNCTARLTASPSFKSEDSVNLGAIDPSQIALAEFAVATDGNVSTSDYNLQCELNYDGGSILLQIPARVEAASNSLIYIMIAASIVLVTGVAIGVSWKKRLRKPKWRKFSR